jgi:hypothetical protein
MHMDVIRLVKALAGTGQGTGHWLVKALAGTGQGTGHWLNWQALQRPLGQMSCKAALSRGLVSQFIAVPTVAIQAARY